MEEQVLGYATPGQVNLQGASFSQNVGACETQEWDKGEAEKQQTKGPF